MHGCASVFKIALVWCSKRIVESTVVAAMVKQLITFSLLWSFVLFLAPVPALGNFESGDCTVGDSPGKIVY